MFAGRLRFHDCYQQEGWVWKVSKYAKQNQPTEKPGWCPERAGGSDRLVAWQTGQGEEVGETSLQFAEVPETLNSQPFPHSRQFKSLRKDIGALNKETM